MSREFLNLLNCMDFKQHVTQQTHNGGHILDLVMTHGLSLCVSSVVYLDFSDPDGVFFNVTNFNQHKALVRMLRKCYLSPKVAANFTEIIKSTSAEILPAPFYC